VSGVVRASVATPLGVVIVISAQDGLRWVGFDGDARLAWLLPEAARVRRTGDPFGAGDALGAYFAGVPGALAELPVSAPASAFQRAVRTATCAIAPGETRTYGALAQALGRPGAARAVGAANSANPVSLVVPCHRVVGSGGALTGYGGGLERKRRLLELETSTP
jgi:O-6-methylguanine DNA methyltransferase